MLLIVEDHNRIDITSVGREYYASRLNCSKCETIRVSNHNCVLRKRCLTYTADKRTIKFEEFRKKFKDFNPSLFET